ncbi:MAG: EcsC family protein [Mogibacterium sp.]|nr:EcsC family protein [Mogibacterium sp.]
MARKLKPIRKVARKARRAVNDAVVDKAVDSVINKYITPEEIIAQVIKLPIAKVDRAAFLLKELTGHYPEETVKTAIEHNPAYAGIDKQEINKIANQVIQHETNKVAGISFAAGLPGGLAMAATIPADVIQYFAFTVRAIQEIAYLYGFDEFDFKEEELDSYAMDQILIFLGAMYGIPGVNDSIRVIAEAAAQKTSKALANEALTKTEIYPVVKKVAKELRSKIAKRIYVKSASKVVPVVGGAVSGGLTYATFKPNCMRLKRSLWDLELCDVGFYDSPHQNA